jgi:hypothetical protein
MHGGISWIKGYAINNLYCFWKDIASNLHAQFESQSKNEKSGSQIFDRFNRGTKG